LHVSLLCPAACPGRAQDYPSRPRKSSGWKIFTKPKWNVIASIAKRARYVFSGGSGSTTETSISSAVGSLISEATSASPGSASLQ
ncbi:MAG: hypothetical protein WB995_18515, partial [Candidatus Acidiferrales bacterium]